MIDFSVISALVMWAINIIALLWVNAKYKEQLNEMESLETIGAITENKVISILEGLTDVKIEQHKLAHDLQQIKVRLHWSKEREKKDLKAEKKVRK